MAGSLSHVRRTYMAHAKSARVARAAVFSGLIAMGVGCQVPPELNPFAAYGPSRVPPPGTGAIGSAARSYDSGVSTAQRGSTFGTPGQQRPDLGTTPSGAAPEDQGWSNAGASSSSPSSQPPRGSAPASGPANTPPGNPFGSTAPAPTTDGDALPPAMTEGSNTFAQATLMTPDGEVSLASAPSAAAADELTWLDPRDRSAVPPSLAVVPSAAPGAPSVPTDNLAARRSGLLPRLAAMFREPAQSPAPGAPVTPSSTAGAARADLAVGPPRLRFSDGYGGSYVAGSGSGSGLPSTISTADRLDPPIDATWDR